jgi:DNA-binding transcriptional MocR family regulator
VLLQLPSSGPPAESLAERAAQRSIELFPVGRCYHAGRSPAGHDGLVLGYAALPEHDFGPGLAALGELLAEALGPPRP